MSDWFFQRYVTMRRPLLRCRRAASPAARACMSGLLADATTEDRERLLTLQGAVREPFADRRQLAEHHSEIPLEQAAILPLWQKISWAVLG
jgi:hypothetical protein